MSQILRESISINGQDLCVIIPTYNNASTIEDVINGVIKYTNNIIVVDDGSTDDTLTILEKFKTIDVITYEKNIGKGWAIRKGFEKALSLGFDYAITIDSDGQHFPDDIPIFVDALEKYPESLIIGSRNITADGMPSKNTFANKFSNFWFWAETNIKLPDTQSGFRLYPIKLYKNTKFYTLKYEFEIEVLVRSAWSDIKIIPMPIKVYYPPTEERVSHFRPLPDFSRISLLNTVFVLITFLYIIPIRAFKYLTNNKFTRVIKEQIMLHNENPAKISAGIGFGVFMGIAPIWGFQMIVAVTLAHFLKLNKIIVLAFSNISLPPLIPFIIYLSYAVGGLVMDNPMEFTTETMYYLKDQIMQGEFYNTLNEFGYSILQYIIGSILFGLLLGGIAAAISYIIIKLSTIKQNKS
ncbi:MAG: glycosyltransferase [Bacteroidetes bacterium]|nr:glycosyltransferase [Bacteroidota bacterium]